MRPEGPFGCIQNLQFLGSLKVQVLGCFLDTEKKNVTSENVKICKKIISTPLKRNMASRNRVLQKENLIGNHRFFGSMVSFPGDPKVQQTDIVIIPYHPC